MALTFEPLPTDLASAVTRDAHRLGRFSALHFLSEAASTNDVALTLALEGAAEGTAVLAETQRAGRGRRGHQWFSPPGAGVYLSAVVRPEGPPGSLPLITLAAGVAAAGAIRAATGLPAELKWPNDIVIGRPWRKLGGILTEAAGTGGRVDAIIVGIGINVRRASYPVELQEAATSVETELGRTVERAPLVTGLLVRLRLAVDQFHAGARDVIRHEWRGMAAAGFKGVFVRWDDQGIVRRGRAHDVDVDGALLVETHGRLERVIGGDVHWEGLTRE